MVLDAFVVVLFICTLFGFFFFLFHNELHDPDMM